MGFVANACSGLIAFRCVRVLQQLLRFQTDIFSVFQWRKSLLVGLARCRRSLNKRFNFLIQNWQYLFIIEGSLTMLLAIIALLILPRNVETSRFFNAAEKECSRLRLGKEVISEDTKFSWSSTLMPLLDWHTWLFGSMSLCYGVAAASISNFLPVSPLLGIRGDYGRG